VILTLMLITEVVALEVGEAHLRGLVSLLMPCQLR
jgi:hypothetical protein